MKKRAAAPKSISASRNAKMANAASKKAATKAKGTDPARVRAILAALDKAYPAASCALHHKNPFQLLISTILSAQCTDERVNQVTPALFKQYPAPRDFAVADSNDVEAAIRSTGFFRNKTKSILGASRKIVDEFGGKVPRTMEEMLSLPGVARKTANVVLGTAFGIPSGVVVDTHVQRLSHRLDLSGNTDPKKIEQDLMAVIPRERWILFSHQLIWHGRRVCQARRPKCIECNLEKVCYAADKTFSSAQASRPIISRAGGRAAPVRNARRFATSADRNPR
jgi:endonuclease-3